MNMSHFSPSSQDAKAKLVKSIGSKKSIIGTTEGHQSQQTQTHTGHQASLN